MFIKIKLNDALIEQCKDSNFEAMAVTVDTAVGEIEKGIYTLDLRYQ